LHVVAAKQVLKFKRNMLLAVGFERWLVTKIDVMNRSTIDIERNRLIRQQQYSSKMETEALRKLTVHFESRDGIMQIQEIIKEQSSNGTLGQLGRQSWLKVEDPTIIKSDICRQCSMYTKELAYHDFEARAPPFLRCLLPSCRAIFTTEQQYLSHMVTSDRHKNNRSPDYSSLHLLLRNNKQRRDLMNFISRRSGIGPLFNLIELWTDLQEWRRLPSTSLAYQAKAIAIFDTYLDTYSLRAVELLQFDGKSALLSKLLALKTSRANEVYVIKQAGSKTLFRKMFRLPCLTYTAWSDTQVFLPTLLYHLEWVCFESLFIAMQAINEEWSLSEEAVSIQLQKEADEVRRRHDYFDEYKSIRLQGISHWVSVFKKSEIRVAQLADEAVDALIESMADRVVFALFDTAYYDHVREELLLFEQVYHQAEERIVEEIYTLLAPALIKTMLTIPHYRHEALRYMSNNTDDENEERVVREALTLPHAYGPAEYQLSVLLRLTPLEHAHRDVNAAAILIQKQTRRYLACKEAKRRFIAIFLKKYAPSEQKCFYVNVVTGDTSWAPPRLTRRLFPRLNW
jgi:hypothetical protein